MSDVSVVIPWRHSPDREPVLAWCLDQWQLRFPHWPVILGCSAGGGAWVKASAVSDALQHSTSKILVVADADVWSDGIGAAVDVVRDGAMWSIPHRLVHRLTREATADVLAGGRLEGRALERNPYPGMVGGGLVVLTRDAYDQCPLDPRFLGWGQEDASWGIALEALYGRPHRGDHHLYHLWHEPQPRMSLARGSKAGMALLTRYGQAAACGDMRALLSEINAAEQVQGKIAMYTYRNINTGDEASFETRNLRLDRLHNWHLIESPGDDSDCGCATGPRSDVSETVMVPTPEAGERIGVQEEKAPQVVTAPPPAAPPKPEGARPLRPRVYASKAEWAEYALACGLNPAGMTKPQIIAAMTG